MSRLNKLILISLSLVAGLMQSSAFGIIIVHNFSNWSLPLGLILISIAVFPNYLGTLQRNNRVFDFCWSLKKRNQKSRHKIGLFTSIWKAGLTMLMCQLFNPEFKFKIDYFQGEDSKVAYYSMLIVQLTSSMIFYLACSLAFKLRMSRLSFALPLVLITPISVTLALTLKDVSPVPQWFEYFKISMAYSGRSSSFQLPLIYGLTLWWISHLWTTRFIWDNKYNSIETTIKR